VFRHAAVSSRYGRFESETPLPKTYATGYLVAERLMYPLTDRRKVAILQSCSGPAVTTCSLIG